MATLEKIIKVTRAQYQTLIGGGSITKNGVTYTYDSTAMYLVENNSEDLYITSAEFFQEGHTITITISNSYHSAEWRYTKVYDISQADVWSDDHLIGSFSSPDGTIEVLVTTGVMTIYLGGGLVISSDPTITGGITLDFGSNDYYRFNITGNATITFSGIDWDD